MISLVQELNKAELNLQSLKEKTTFTTNSGYIFEFKLDKDKELVLAFSHNRFNKKIELNMEDVKQLNDFLTKVSSERNDEI